MHARVVAGATLAKEQEEVQEQVRGQEQGRVEVSKVVLAAVAQWVASLVAAEGEAVHLALAEAAPLAVEVAAPMYLAGGEGGAAGGRVVAGTAKVAAIAVGEGVEVREAEEEVLVVAGHRSLLRNHVRV